MPPSESPAHGVASGRIAKASPRTPKKQRLGSDSFSAKFSRPKWGWCPECDFGHKVFRRHNPEGSTLFADQLQFVCSNRDTGCTFNELLDDEPIPVGIPDSPSKHAICPQCKKGRLIDKIDNPFNFTKKYRECERKQAPERPCNYREDVKPKQTPTKTGSSISPLRFPSKESATKPNSPLGGKVSSSSRGGEAVSITGNWPSGRMPPLRFPGGPYPVRPKVQPAAEAVGSLWNATQAAASPFTSGVFGSRTQPQGSGGLNADKPAQVSDEYGDFNEEEDMAFIELANSVEAAALATPVKNHFSRNGRT
ncbi:hypothetical protein B0T25DRAFT_527037 [Lasiosphaeria hispida]|uniref:Stc1 domain-containing protein n=1 Tax=Lasiosphaeria hispida TaxID=260671 RepID=A0AAJ0HUU6_9PEZI|nr:hypothetical protein B0T25DRAFT_527037 [Lasiosphaeria hispida]